MDPKPKPKQDSSIIYVGTCITHPSPSSSGSSPSLLASLMPSHWQPVLLPIRERLARLLEERVACVGSAWWSSAPLPLPLPGSRTIIALFHALVSLPPPSLHMAIVMERLLR